MELKQFIGLAVRLFGTSIVAWITARGWLTADEATNFIIMAVTIIVMGVWSIIQKVSSNKETQEALKLPAGSSIEKLKEVIKG